MNKNNYYKISYASHWETNEYLLSGLLCVTLSRNKPSIHSLQCSRCDLYRIAAMPARNHQNKGNIGLKAVDALM